jgi:hypothetical protein
MKEAPCPPKGELRLDFSSLADSSLKRKVDFYVTNRGTLILLPLRRALQLPIFYSTNKNNRTLTCSRAVSGKPPLWGGLEGLYEESDNWFKQDF